MDCQRCGRETSNTAINGAGLENPGPLSEFNGVVWLCDEHEEQFIKWLKGFGAFDPDGEESFPWGDLDGER